MTLAGCGAEGSGSAGDSSAETLTIGYLASYTDTLSMAYLLEDQLTAIGYEVELEPLTEIGPIFAGLASGGIDIFSSSWPDITHAEYMDEYSEDIEDLVTYYEGAENFLAVPSYMDIDSIDDLDGMADTFDGTITGIEPGAGLTRQTQEVAIPDYGLDDEYELQTSSTPAMLTALGEAIENEEPIVVTLWKPYWANGAYDITALEDPQGGMGASETMHVLGTAGFSDSFPEAAELIAGISLDDAQYETLEDTVVNHFEEGQETEAIDQWIAENAGEFDWLQE